MLRASQGGRQDQAWLWPVGPSAHAQLQEVVWGLGGGGQRKSLLNLLVEDAPEGSFQDVENGPPAYLQAKEERFTGQK